MLLSEKIKQYLPNTIFSVYNEIPVQNIGYTDSPCDNCASFVTSFKYLATAKDNIKMLIIPDELKDECLAMGKGCIVVNNPKDIFWALHEALANDSDYARNTFLSKISPSATISPLAYIATNNVIIDENVIIEPFVTIYEDCHIGSNSIIRSGSRIGCTGFLENRVNEKINTIKHLGGTVIGNHVDIRNNTCIDKAIFPWDNTIVESECKIDTFVQIAHGCKIGSGTLIVSGSIIAGKTSIGKNCWIGLSSTIRNGLTIGDGAHINMGSVVVNNITDNQEVSGNYAIDHHKFLYNHLRSL